MFERPKQGEQALVVHVGLAGDPAADALSEFESLARSAGAELLETLTGMRASPEPRFFVGSGKAEEIAGRVQALGAELVLFNHPLSPSQERNLERLLKCRVLDRTGLILDIFAQRARSHEGKLQVELAQLRHLSTRLVRGWTHLERQKGGIGLRGPGETQLETDRRLIAGRIKQIERRLKAVRSRRDQGRQARRKAEVPTVSLVGYTNAGKSTLFNAVTRAEVYSADQLFATLDPTLRRFELGADTAVVLADTVGFIQDLPHELVAAFHSTLQETAEADLLLHVVDASDPNRDEHIGHVDDVLEMIGAQGVPRILVYNKIDAAGREVRVDEDEQGNVERIWLSAVTGEGLDALAEALLARVRGRIVEETLHLPPTAGRARARLFALGAVVSESVSDDGGFDIAVRMPREALEQWRSEHVGDLHGAPQTR
ncbi:MAG: ribosome rescue GTPase HflX [Gammaproteobacteria bacterium]